MYTVYYLMHFCFTIKPLWLSCANAFVLLSIKCTSVCCS